MVKEWNVGRLLDMSSGYWRGCAVQAAVRLKVFSALQEDGAEAAQVARAIGGDVRATGLLLDALAALGLVAKTAGRYANTPFSAQHLVVGRPGYMGHIIMHHHNILDGWAQLDQAVLTGKKVNRRSYGVEFERESFLMGMFNLAMGLAPQMAAQFQLAGRRRLLDLGGGPGTYAIHFCQANPGLSAVILDRPTTEPFARETVARFGLTGRIDFIGGDFTVDPFGGGPYDVAWLSHILHSNSEADCQQCLEKTAAVLEPGGLILIHEFILNDAKDGPEFPALFALNMLLGTEGGRSYSRAEIAGMLTAAGFTDIAHHECRTANDSSVISGRKP
jgi:SAM-dependent methyltransferase